MNTIKEMHNQNLSYKMQKDESFTLQTDLQRFYLLNQVFCNQNSSSQMQLYTTKGKISRALMLFKPLLCYLHSWKLWCRYVTACAFEAVEKVEWNQPRGISIILSICKIWYMNGLGFLFSKISLNLVADVKMPQILGKFDNFSQHF